MVEVFLRRAYNPNIIFEVELQINEGDYEKVAEIDLDQLEGSYNTTQNVERSWLNKEGVSAVKKMAECRSSSIGDIFSVNGQLNILLPLGYKTVKWGDSVTLKPEFLSK